MEYRDITNTVLCITAVIILGIIFYKHIKTPEAERSVEWQDKITFLYALFFLAVGIFLIKNNVAVFISFQTF